MKKILAFCTAAILAGMTAAACAADNFSYSAPVDLRQNRQQDTFARSFTWNDVHYSVTEGQYKLIFTFNDGKYTETHDITGYHVSKAEMGDINGDGQPELFVYLKSDKHRPQMKFIGYSSNNGRSMSRVYLPEPQLGGEAYKGYAGFDEMFIKDNTFCRRFPLVKKADGKTYLSGMLRQIDYKLVNGEAGRILEVDKFYDQPLFEGQ